MDFIFMVELDETLQAAFFSLDLKVLFHILKIIIKSSIP